jgi:hypothetical protein
MTDMSDAVFSCGRPEELEQFGLAVGMRITLVELKNLQERYGFEAILYFDEDLARNSTLGDDAADFRILPVQARPFMPLAISCRLWRSTIRSLRFGCRKSLRRSRSWRPGRATAAPGASNA